MTTASIDPNWRRLPDFDLPFNVAGWAEGPWWEREALEAIDAGRCHAITGRNTRDLYLLRMWLSVTTPHQDDRFDSGDALLLHYFARGDDDKALHDHPWDFRATILSGGYVEHRPPLSWPLVTKGANPEDDFQRGPPWNENRTEFVAGNILTRQAEDLHCVSAVQAGTFTLVRTGPRRRDWGFHPPGKAWMPWREFLAGKVK